MWVNGSSNCSWASDHGEPLWLGTTQFYMNSWFPAVEMTALAESFLALRFVMLWCYIRSVLLLSLSSVAFPLNGEEAYTLNSEAAFRTLQTWYNETTGIYDTTGWWNSANGLTTVADLAAVSPKTTSQIIEVLANSFVAAPKTNLGLQATKEIKADFNIVSSYSIVPLKISDSNSTAKPNPEGFLNDFYDDEGWWALAWIQAYDITQKKEYLQAAEDIFSDMKKGSTTPCGGIWWDKPKTYVNAIANELYLSVASHLANRANRTLYLPIAQEQFTWFQESGMINSQNLINDGLTTDCKNNNGTVWSYNQGVILGALVELNTASPNPIYLNTASAVAVAAMSALSVNGILHDPCGTDCGADGSQFKGVFMRNLQKLQKAAPDQKILAYVEKNAKSIWGKGRESGSNKLGLLWEGPFTGPGIASLQSSGLDGLIAAAAFEGKGIY